MSELNDRLQKWMVPAGRLVAGMCKPLMERLAAPGLRPPETLYHYTNFAAMKSIVESGTLWATDVRFMNDAHELAYPKSVLQAGFKRLAANCTSQGEEDLVEKLSQDDVFGESWNRIYVVSFSTRDDSLSQWRGYGAHPGVSIGFNFQHQFLFDHLPLMPVIYGAQAQDALVDECLSIALEAYRAAESLSPEAQRWVRTYSGQQIRDAVLHFLPQFKNAVWQDEDEWRIIIALGYRGGPIKVHHRPSIFGLTPYISLDLTDQRGADVGKLPIKSVRVGPTAHPELSKTALESYLQGIGLEAPWIEVASSAIPLR